MAVSENATAAFSLLRGLADQGNDAAWWQLVLTRVIADLDGAGEEDGVAVIRMLLAALWSEEPGRREKMLAGYEQLTVPAIPLTAAERDQLGQDSGVATYIMGQASGAAAERARVRRRIDDMLFHTDGEPS
jgi:hypothetical protein